jgi:hypothetical protein
MNVWWEHISKTPGWGTETPTYLAAMLGIQNSSCAWISNGIAKVTNCYFEYLLTYMGGKQ